MCVFDHLSTISCERELNSGLFTVINNTLNVSITFSSTVLGVHAKTINHLCITQFQNTVAECYKHKYLTC